jgi:O-antigen ligase
MLAFQLKNYIPELLFTSRKRFLAKVHACGSWGLDFCFTLLCLRFIGANFYEAQGYPVSTLVIVGIYFGLACWRPRAALFILALTAPLIMGFSATQLISTASPLFLSFSALWIGIFTHRWIFSKTKLIEPLATGSNIFFSSSWLIIAVDLLFAWILISIVVSLWPHRQEPRLWHVIYKTSGIGYADQYYTLHSAFIWLQGLFFCKSLIKIGFKGYAYNNTAKQNLKPKSNLSSWFRFIIGIYTISLLGFSTFQYFLRIPDLYLGSFLLSPYEDVFALGGATVMMWAALLTFINWRSKTIFLLQLLAFSAASTLLIMTWIRGVWLAAGLAVLLQAYLRLSAKSMVVIFFFAFISWGASNQLAKKGGAWETNPYLSRLHSLIRVESLANKSSGRFDLYYKAIGMIQSRPWSGHGVGSFFLTSTRFARKGDLLGSQPEFAHNFILQFAAELGIPATLLLCGIISAALIKGFKRSKTVIRNKERDSTPLALFIALFTYLVSQMTFGALNIYIGQQYFFWFLIAALLTLPNSQAEKRTNAIL